MQNQLTFTVDKLMCREVLTDACARRADEMTRRAIIDALNAVSAFETPYDSCFTTGELARDLYATGLWSRI